MTTQTEALKLALEALDEKVINEYKVVRAITAIKEALSSPNGEAQPEQTNTRPYYTIDELNAWADEKEKQAWRSAAIRIGEELSSVGPDGYYDMNAWQWLDWAMENVKKAQPEKTVCPFCSSEWVTAEQHDRKMDRLEQEPVAYCNGMPAYEGPLSKTQRKEPEQEPVATLDDLEQEIYENTRQFVSRDVMEWMLKRYYTTPPQRKPLTDEEIGAILEGVNAYGTRLYTFARAIEAVHGIKELK